MGTSYVRAEDRTDGPLCVCCFPPGPKEAIMLGIIEGAIIGAAIGLITSLVVLLRRKGLRDKFLRLLGESGPDAARRLLDQKLPPLKKIPLGKILDQRERMAALTVLGQTDTILEELAGHRGPLTATVQVASIGLLGVALRGDAGDGARRLDEVAARMEQEGGRAMKLVKKKTRALATLARAMAEGEPIPSDVRLTLESFTGDGGMVQILVWQATAVALEQTGGEQQAAGLRTKVRAMTDAFEK
jgi:hypothetical protein